MSLESTSAKSVFTSKKIRSLPNQMSASDFVSVDSDAETGHSLTDEEIVELVTATDMDDRDEDEDEDSDPSSAVTLSDALVAVHTLTTFMEQDFLSFKDETRAILSFA